MHCLFCTDFIDAEPGCPYDTGIQFSVRVKRNNLAGEGKAQVGGTIRSASPMINTGQHFRPKTVAGFFQHLAAACLEDGFTGLQMTSRLLSRISVLLEVSSTSKYLPFCSMTAATVTLGFQIIWSSA